MDYLYYIMSSTASIGSKSYSVLWNTFYKNNSNEQLEPLSMDSNGIKNVIHDYKRIKTRYAANKKIIDIDKKYGKDLESNIEYLKEINKELNDEYIDEWIVMLEHRKTVILSDLNVLIRSQKVFKEFSIKDETHDIDTITVCNVCMENKKDRSLDCGHIFCHVCIKEIDKCPTCRVNIDKNKIRPVFL